MDEPAILHTHSTDTYRPPSTIYRTATATETSNTFQDTQTGITSSDAEALLQNYHAARSETDLIPSTRASQAGSLTQFGSLFDNDHSSHLSFPTTILDDDLVPAQESLQGTSRQTLLPQQNVNRPSILLLASTPPVEPKHENAQSAINTAQLDSPSPRVTSFSTQTRLTRYEDMHIESSTKKSSKSDSE